MNLRRAVLRCGVVSSFVFLVYFPCRGQQLISQCYRSVPGADSKETSDPIVRACPADLHIPLSMKIGGKMLSFTLGTGGDIDIPKDQAELYARVLNNCASDQAFIVHVAHWIVGDKDTYALRSSQWFVYHGKSKITSGCSLELNGYKANDKQLLYNDKNALLIGFTVFDNKKVEPAKVAVAYKVSTTPEVPENITDLGTLLEQFFGGQATSSLKGVTAPTAFDTFVAITFIPPLNKLPFDFNATYGLAVVGVGTVDAMAAGGSTPPKNNPAQNSNQSSPTGSQAADCTNVAQKAPCTISRSFRTDDREYFDFSLAVAIPGIHETKFKPNATSTGLTSSLTRHTDVYAMVDLFPLAYWRYKQDNFFHLLVGVPVTSNPLYRPFFGGAIDLTGWTGLQRKGFPLQMSVFGGVVYMKEQVPENGLSSTSLISTRSVKGVFGIEVPVSALASKIGKAAKSSTAKGGS
jgi:hypothetical protein